MNKDILKITIDNRHSVELSSLVDMMSGVAAYLYKNLIKSNPAYNKLETKLLIDKVTKGSIILDLVSVIQSLNSDLSPLVKYSYKFLLR